MIVSIYLPPFNQHIRVRKPNSWHFLYCARRLVAARVNHERLMEVIEREKKKSLEMNWIDKKNCDCIDLWSYDDECVKELCVCVLDETVNKGETFQGQLSEISSLSLQLSIMIHRWRQGQTLTFFHSHTFTPNMIHIFLKNII
jgi:hypothetical protein